MIETRTAQTEGMEHTVNTVERNRWDKPTTAFAWCVLIAFTVLSCYINAVYADATGSLVWFHTGIPAVVLVSGLFAELVFLSSAHRWAKWIVVTGLASVFVVVLVASYLAILHMVIVWNPAAPVWVNNALAAIPDVVMVMAATVVLSLRKRAHTSSAKQSKTEAAPRTPSRLRRLADAATNRAEAALTVPSSVQVEAVTEVRGGSANTVAETPAVSVAETDRVSPTTVAETPAEVRETGSRTPAPTRRPSPRAVAKPSVDPELEPFMDAARSMEVDGLVRGKTAEDYAKIIAALQRGWSPTRIKSEFSYSHDTTRKVVEALEQADQPRVLTAV